MIPISSDRMRSTIARGGCWRNSLIRSIPAIVLVLASMQIAGCIAGGGGASNLVFSPDGTRIAFLREDSLQELAVDGKKWFRTITLHWCSTSEPAKESSVHIDTLGAEYRGYIHVGTEVKWSPNGSRIGVWTPYKLTIVEISSGRKIEIRDGTIWSFAWSSDGQVVYCTRCTKSNMQRRVICRVDLETQQKTEIVAFPERPVGGSPRRENWSPSGRFVIFMEPDIGGQYHCVDVFDGTVRSFGQTDAYDVGVAWAPDSSRAFCVSNKVGPGDMFEALLLDPVTGTTVDCTAGFQDTFADHAPSLVPLWTVDGKYVLVNALHINGHLVQPDPWQVVPLGEMLASRFTPPTTWSTINPRLFRLPVPGWVGVVPTGNYGDSPVQYATDYSGQRVVPLLEDYPRAISPDGTTAATIGKDGRIMIHRLGKWWLPSAKPVSSMPGLPPASATK